MGQEFLDSRDHTCLSHLTGMLVITCPSNTLAETYIKRSVNMTTVILVKKGDQVQEEIECRVHKLICTYSLSPVPERQKGGVLRGAGVEMISTEPNLNTSTS